METYRTFIAIKVKVNSELKSKWQEIRVLLNNDNIKWVDEQSLHLTLFFLGETPANLVDNIANSLEMILKKNSSFKIKLQSFGTFGNIHSPKVIWVGIVKSEELYNLQKDITSTLVSLGFDEPKGNFSPHFTLGRIKQIESSDELFCFIKGNKTNFLQEVEVDRVILYQSILKPKGPIYLPLKEIKLLSL